MPLPPDIANLLAIAVRDVIWFKDRVYNFFRTNDVPPVILKDVRRLQQEKVPTIKIVHQVLGELEKFGDSGWVITKKLLTSMHHWKDLQSIEPDRKPKAEKSLAALRQACDAYLREQALQERQEMERREREMHQTRIERSEMKALDHKLLQSLRDEFDEIYPMTDTQKRGNRFEQLLNEIFRYYSERSEGSFNRVGEQLDGLFYFDKHCYYVEARWKRQKTNAGDISKLRDRAVGGFGGDTKALFISFEGYTKDCLDSLMGRTDERVLLMDGGDVRLVLDCQVAFDVLLAEKQIDIVRNRRPFVSGFEIVAKLKNSEAR
jgi:Restriction endonuclease